MLRRTIIVAAFVASCTPTTEVSLSTDGRPLIIVVHRDATGTPQRAALHAGPDPVELNVLEGASEASIAVLSFDFDALEATVPNADRSRAAELDVVLAAPPSEPELVLGAERTHARSSLPAGTRADVLLLGAGADAHFERRDDEVERLRSQLTLLVPALPIGVCRSPPVVQLTPFQVAGLFSVPVLRFNEDEVLVVTLDHFTIHLRGTGTSTTVSARVLNAPRPGFATQIASQVRDPVRSDAAKTVVWFLTLECPDGQRCASGAESPPGAVVRVEFERGGLPRVTSRAAMPNGNGHLVISSDGEPWVVVRDGRTWRITNEPPQPSAGPRAPADVLGVGPTGEADHPFLIASLDRVFLFDRVRARFDPLPEPPFTLLGTPFNILSGQQAAGLLEVWAGGYQDELYRWRGEEAPEQLRLPAPANASACGTAGETIHTNLMGLVPAQRHVFLTFENCNVLIVYDSALRCTFGVPVAGSSSEPRTFGKVDVQDGRWLTIANLDGIWELDLDELRPPTLR